MPEQTGLASRSAFAGLLRNVGEGAGVVVRDRDGLGLATVIARKGKAPALTEAARAAFALDLPSGPRRAAVASVAFAGAGRSEWLASREPDAGFAAELVARLGAFAAISDQSGGLAVLRLGGPHVRDALAKGVPIDIDATAFRVGDVAATVCSHIGVTLWRLDDEAGGPVFELAVARSFAGGLWSWLAAAAAEYGLVVEPCGAA